MVGFGNVCMDALHKGDNDDYDNNNNNNCYYYYYYYYYFIFIVTMEAKHSTSDPDSNIIYGSNFKVTITKSKRDLTCI